MFSHALPDLKPVLAKKIGSVGSNRQMHSSCRALPAGLLQDMDGAPHRKSWEAFTAVDAGGGKAPMLVP